MKNRNVKQRVMMKRIFILITAMLVLAGCQNETGTTTNDSMVTDNKLPDTLMPAVDSVTPVSLHNGTHCFAYTKNKDTISMTLMRKDSAASGKLVYNLYGKDKNTGTFKGFLHRDTLLADYNFSSEGTRSVRQVVFLLKGDILLQGSGSMKEQNGRFVFSNKKDISFDGNTVLEPIDCSGKIL